MAKKAPTPIEYYNANKRSMKQMFHGLNIIVEELEKYPQLSHASNILTKAVKTHKGKDTKAKKVLNVLIPQYIAYYTSLNEIHSYDNSTIESRAAILDDYYAFFDKEKIEQTFDPRSKIRATILEEFTFLFLKEKVDSIKKERGGANEKYIHCGAVKAYSNLYITAKNIEGFVNEPPMPRINEKDQDYTIYCDMDVIISNELGTKSDTKRIHVPILAIENKTYLDKTMLEGAIATAEKLKSGNPYSTYIVVTETYAVANDVDPAYSRIDQIFVLRKCKHDKNNRRPQPISPDVLGRLVKMVEARLTDTWADVENRMQNKGEIINQLGA